MIEKIVVFTLVISFLLTISARWGVTEWIYQKTGFNCRFCYAFWLMVICTALSIIFQPMDWDKIVMIFCVPPLVNFILSK